jgi:hypothetical protein
VIEVVVKSAFETWDDLRHESAVFETGPGGCVIVPLEVAAHVEFNGGYRRATAADIEAEIIMLEERAERLRAHLERLSAPAGN